jgi:hypothetical protein
MIFRAKARLAPRFQFARPNDMIFLKLFHGGAGMVDPFRIPARGT